MEAGSGGNQSQDDTLISKPRLSGRHGTREELRLGGPGILSLLLAFVGHRNTIIITLILRGSQDRWHATDGLFEEGAVL